MTLQDQWAAAVLGATVTPSVVTLDSALRAAAPSDLAPRFRERVCMASVAAAIAIANEAPTTPAHASRAALAKLVTNNPFVWMAPFSIAIASQGLDYSATDAQISSAIASVWNALAG